jgi:hypothetical protein
MAQQRGCALALKVLLLVSLSGFAFSFHTAGLSSVHSRSPVAAYASQQRLSARAVSSNTVQMAAAVAQVDCLSKLASYCRLRMHFCLPTAAHVHTTRASFMSIATPSFEQV